MKDEKTLSIVKNTNHIYFWCGMLLGAIIGGFSVLIGILIGEWLF